MMIIIIIIINDCNNTLICRYVPKLFILLLYSWFTNISFCVRWKNCLPCSNCIYLGLLQVNLLSFKKDNVYVDDLVHRLEKSNFGIKIFDQFFGAIMYADDITLLSSSLNNSQCMIDICIQFGKEMGISFGYLKS